MTAVLLEWPCRRGRIPELTVRRCRATPRRDSAMAGLSPESMTSPTELVQLTDCVRGHLADASAKPITAAPPVDPEEHGRLPAEASSSRWRAGFRARRLRRHQPAVAHHDAAPIDTCGRAMPGNVAEARGHRTGETARDGLPGEQPAVTSLTTGYA